jgi:hypothetical protein
MLAADRGRLLLPSPQPSIVCDMGYRQTQFAPGMGAGLPAMYTCGHNLLKAHAKAAGVFR